MDDDADSLSGPTITLWIEIIKEARLLAGKAAARRVWRQSPLPALDAPRKRRAGLYGKAVEEFVKSCCVVTGSPTDVLSAADLQARFHAWVRSGSFDSLTPTGFCRQLKALSLVYRAPGSGVMFKARKASVSTYSGIRWIDTPAPPFDASTGR